MPAYGNMSIMFPMITSLRELQDAKAVLEECKAELTAEGKKFSDKIEVGTMIETPAAVLVADDLAQECDFFSIGTNDLTQYTCALDRQNAKLEPFFDPHHPAVLKAIRMTIEAGRRRSGYLHHHRRAQEDLGLLHPLLYRLRFRSGGGLHRHQGSGWIKTVMRGLKRTVRMPVTG